MLASLLLTGAPLTGQPPPTERVIHLWVDPIYGNDGTGTGPNDVQSYFNPQAQVAQLDCGVAVNAPHYVLDPANNAPLLHAPHPFKTITAAIAYVNRLRTGPTGPPPLPHTDPVTNVTWAYCIIHLLPGWYGHPVGFQQQNNSSSLSTATDTHRDNALVPNGDTFPLHIPPRVSLKGTSVLNTVIDPGGIGTAIEFGRLINGVELNGEGSFIDSITFYGCGTAPNPLARNHAAILLDDECASQPTISNCVFAVNMIGVLVSANYDVSQDPTVPTATVVHDGTTIVNCTFAWNGIGLWNGQLGVPDPVNDIAVGFSKLNLINNIFDGSAPNGGQNLPLPCNLNNTTTLPRSWPSGGNGLQVASAFEGIVKQDLQVSVGGQPVDTNAYESGVDRNMITDRNYNRRARPTGGGAGNLPQTDPRITGSFDPDAGKNIAFITGHPNQTSTPPAVRGILFIADLICHGRAAGLFTGTANPGFDGSMLDFRLSPAVTPAAATNNPPSQLNPLVDSGFDGPFPAMMGNGQTINSPPGFLTLNATSQDSWQHHNWETDGEGYGNPRIHDHPVYPNTGPGSVAGTIDIGADEVANLIVAGYRLGTTTFLQLRGGVRGSGSNEPHPDNPETRDNVPVDNRRLWYLGPPTSLTPPSNALPQPSYRTYGVLASTQVYPPTYLPKTWHSGEVSGTVPNRPWYAIRNNQMPTRTQPPPVRPSCVCLLTAGGCPNGVTAADMGNAYRATLADIAPHLLPDVHPWWSPMGAVAFGVGVHVMAPSFHLWQNCNGTTACDPAVSWQPNPLGFYNSFLYQDPLAGNVNPPGAALGMTDIVTSKSFVWLDGQNQFLEQPRAFPFSVWQGANPLVITDFDAWCLGGTPGNREVVLPSTSDPSAAELTALRYSLEWANDEELWLPVPEETLKNIQSFLVVVEQ